MSSNVSRRSFFKGAGLAALGGLSAAALSGCGHGYAAEAPANPSAGDFGGPSWLGAPPVIEESEIAETIDTEVLVVGMGTGGIPAMISAAENGARVLGIDRQGEPRNVREDIGAIDSRLQQASFDEYPELRIEKKEAVEDIVRYANGFVSYDLVKLWADESGAMVDWLTDIIQRDGKMVMEFEGGVGDTSDPGRDKAFATGHSPQKTSAVAEDEEWGFAESILAYAAEQGAETRWYTEFVKCETDEAGRVTGVIARDVQGDRRYMRINASRGVILSTGGYGNNLEMMEDRQAWNQKIRIAAPGSGGNPTGSGIKAALWLGATMDPLGAACTFNRACVRPDQYAGGGVLGRWFWFGEQPFLKLNLKGERFCNESGPYDYMLHSTIMQPHQTYVDIWDANHAAQAEAMDEVGCCRLFPFPNGAKNNIPMAVVDGMIEKLIEDGYVQKADTMEELAEKLNLPVETTVASWKHYNEMAAAGEDTDYYKEKHRLMAIDTPPFYGVRTGAWFLATLDGVTIDTNMHPCNEDGDPIEGLYLTGNDSGGSRSTLCRLLAAAFSRRWPGAAVGSCGDGRIPSGCPTSARRRWEGGRRSASERGQRAVRHGCPDGAHHHRRPQPLGRHYNGGLGQRHLVSGLALGRRRRHAGQWRRSEHSGLGGGHPRRAAAGFRRLRDHRPEALHLRRGHRRHRSGARGSVGGLGRWSRDRTGDDPDARGPDGRGGLCRPLRDHRRGVLPHAARGRSVRHARPRPRPRLYRGGARGVAQHREGPREARLREARHPLPPRAARSRGALALEGRRPAPCWGRAAMGEGAQR